LAALSPSTPQDFAVTFVAIFVALDVIGILPMYIAMTRDLPHPDATDVLNKSLLVAFLVAAVFSVAGAPLLRYLGITIADFQIAGGLVLLLVSLADLIGRPEAANRASGSTGIVPLAVPLITGPGVLATVILQVTLHGYAITLLALLLNYLIAWRVLRSYRQVTRVLGRDGTVVVSKIAALLLAAIAVAMIRNGIFSAIRASFG